MLDLDPVPGNHGSAGGVCRHRRALPFCAISFRGRSSRGHDKFVAPGAVLLGGAPNVGLI